MTELRYLPAADDVTTFTARVTGATPEYLLLKGTYFYPEGGGQPADRGVLTWGGGRAEIAGARTDHGEVRHDVASMQGEPPDEGTLVEGQIDEERRRRLSKMHTAQHVVSRVVLDRDGATTAGNQINPERSRIDFEPAEFDDGDLRAIQERANAVIDRDLAVTKEHRSRETVEAQVDEGRALLDLLPESVDPLRVVEIGDVDMCPCGGTHVERLGDIGQLEITDRTSKGEDVERVEFTLLPT